MTGEATGLDCLITTVLKILTTGHLAFLKSDDHLIDQFTFMGQQIVTIEHLI